MMSAFPAFLSGCLRCPQSKRAASSLLATLVSDRELIVVDNASDDDSVAVLDPLDDDVNFVAEMLDKTMQGANVVFTCNLLPRSPQYGGVALPP
jgi:hypothetical protein